MQGGVILSSKKPEPPPPPVEKLVGDGWTIVSDGPSGVQLIAPRKLPALDKAALVVAAGIVWFAAPVSALIGLAVAFDYWVMGKRERRFLPRG